MSQYCRAEAAAAAGTATEAKDASGRTTAVALPEWTTVCAADRFTTAVTAAPPATPAPPEACRSWRVAAERGGGAAAPAASGGAARAAAAAGHSSIWTRMKGGMARADGAWSSSRRTVQTCWPYGAAPSYTPVVTRATHERFGGSSWATAPVGSR
jgi:hypothetical protein